MSELHENKPGSPNRNTCNICGTDIAGLETLCVECKRIIKAGNSYSESLKQQRDDLLVALRKYGEHETGCVLGDACNCGLDAAIAKYPA